MHNSKIEGFMSLLTYNAWNLKALAFIKLFLKKNCIATSDANSTSFFNYIDVMVNECRTVVISINSCLT